MQVSQATGHFPPGTTIVRLTDGHSVEEVGRAIYVQQEGMRARLEAKRNPFKFKNPFKRKLTSSTNQAPPQEGIQMAGISDSTSISVDTIVVDPREDAPTSLAHRAVCGVKSVVADGMRRHRRKNPGGANEPVGLVIDGNTLRHAISVSPTVT